MASVGIRRGASLLSKILEWQIARGNISNRGVKVAGAKCKELDRQRQSYVLTLGTSDIMLVLCFNHAERGVRSQCLCSCTALGRLVEHGRCHVVISTRNHTYVHALTGDSIT